jgi:hypothetical protein
LIEVFEEGIELSPNASFALTVYGELLSSVHTAYSVIGHILIFLVKGKGEDRSLLKISNDNLAEIEQSAVEEV